MMGSALLRLPAAAAVVLFAAAGARAQAPAMADADTNKLKQLLLSGSTPSPQDKAFMVKHVSDRAKEMWAYEDTGETTIATAMERLRTRMHPTTVDYIGGNLPFVQTIAEIYREALLPIVADVKNPPKSLAAYDHVGIVLTSFRHPVLTDAYIKMTELPVEAVGLRFRVMWALQAPPLRTEIISGGNSQKIRNFLLDRCRKETAVGVMGEVFGAMDLNGADDKIALGLLLAGLRARLDNYLAGKMDGVGAEPRALESIERIRGANEAILNASKNEVIELVAKVLHVAGTRYTEFNQARVDVLRIRKVPVALVRLGVWDTVIVADRLLTTLLAGMKDAGSKNPAVEKAFLELMTSVVDGGKNLGQDPVENLYRPENISTSVYVPFLKQLEERRAQVSAVLKAAKHANADIPDPKEWKVSDQPGAAPVEAPKAKKDAPKAKK